jgi:hypothetical protein
MAGKIYIVIETQNGGPSKPGTKFSTRVEALPGLNTSPELRHCGKLNSQL